MAKLASSFVTGVQDRMKQSLDEEVARTVAQVSRASQCTTYASADTSMGYSHLKCKRWCVFVCICVYRSGKATENCVHVSVCVCACVCTD